MFARLRALWFNELEQTVPVHLTLLRAAFPESAYDRLPLGDVEAVDRFASVVAPVTG